MKNKIIIILLVILSCSKSTSNNILFEVDLNDLSENLIPELSSSIQKVPFSFDDPGVSSSDFFERNIEYVLLETNEISLFGDMENLLFTENSIIIQDDMTKSILIFDHSGKFKRKIKRPGEGPEEYRSMKSISYNHFQKVIDVNDNTRGIIQKYDVATGEYLSTVDIGFLIDSFQSISDSLYAFFLDSYLFDEERYEQISGLNKQLLIGKVTPENTIKIVSQHLDFVPKTEILNYGPVNTSVRGVNGEVLITPLFNDTIYALTADGLKRKYLIDYGDKSIPKDFFQTSNTKDVINAYNSDILPHPVVVWETQEMLFVWSTYSNDRLSRTFYHKDKGVSMSLQKSDFNQAGGAVGYWPIAANDTAFVYKVEPEEVFNFIDGLSDAFLKEGYAKEEQDSILNEIITTNDFDFLRLPEQGLKRDDNQFLAFVRPNFDRLKQ